jgi:cytochrome c peroxidase
MQLFQFIVIFFLLFISSCKKDLPIITPVETTNDNWKFITPSSFPAPIYSFEGNTSSRSKFVLGRYLFYDPILSLDSSISCATCHAQAHSFADHNIPFSIGVGGIVGTRNAPSIFNMAWSPSFFWDGKVINMNMFSMHPILNPVEMKEDTAHLFEKLNRNSFYINQFKKAYNISRITPKYLQLALSQYMAFVISANSKYDQVKAGKEAFTPNEKEGYELFLNHCVQCHKEPLFTDYSFRNNGLDSISKDQGRYNVTKMESDKGKFKVPTLRNIEFTYPYMHDGRFSSIMDVLNHYNSEVKNHPNLDTSLKKNINLSITDKKNIMKFLFTLSDFSLIGDTLIAEPKR